MYILIYLPHDDVSKSKHTFEWNFGPRFGTCSCTAYFSKKVVNSSKFMAEYSVLSPIQPCMSHRSLPRFRKGALEELEMLKFKIQNTDVYL